LRISERDAPEAESEDIVRHGPALPGQGLGQAEIDDLIAVDRSDDIGWREAAPAADEIARVVAADLEIGAAASVPAESPAPSVTPEAEIAPTPAAPAPSRPSARLREAIEALSPAERMALFS
jgi:hypothetical protein